MTLNNDNETEVKTKNLKATTFQNTELFTGKIGKEYARYSHFKWLVAGNIRHLVTMEYSPHTLLF